jgi:hypothetical protein
VIRFAIALALAATCALACAQSIESAIMPGKVIAGHAKYEQDCGECHVRFDRAAQPRLCLDCHKDVAVDVRTASGYHGRLKDRECRTCHTDHRGRAARIVVLDEKAFEHGQTDFALRERHRGVACAECHRPRAKHRDAPSECVGCHRAKDTHRGNLGPRCDDCHDAKDWRHTRFDHATTRFPLARRHADVKCANCHSDPRGEPRYAATPRECVGCHRGDDAHKGLFGPKCESCHHEGRWQTATFQHDRDTHFALRERHRMVKCESCHRSATPGRKLASACIGCHRGDDTHKGTLGPKCESCHSERDWKGGRFDHDRETRFALVDRHRDVRCNACHAPAAAVPPGVARTAGTADGSGPATAVPPRPVLATTCAGCHERDDSAKGHRGRYGARCESCHTAAGWRTITFRHDRDTKFVLRERHVESRCDTCHTGNLYRDRLDTACAACHARDDNERGHRGQLGNACETCHGERTWRVARFDHDRSRFPLRSRHRDVACVKCHASPLFMDAKSDCASCHTKDDTHRSRLGPKCADCHSELDWSRATFDHARQTAFALDGRHARIRCTTCHVQPSPRQLTLPGDCYACHRNEDWHFGTKGRDCERCHNATGWRKVAERPPGRAPLPSPRPTASPAGWLDAWLGTRTP